MKTKLLLKSLLIAGFLAVMFGLPMQASALPNELFSFHQHSGFLVDSTLTSNQSGNNIFWYNNIAPETVPSAPSSTTPLNGTFNTIAWGVPATGTGGQVFTNPLFNASPIDPSNPTNINYTYDHDFSGLFVKGLEGNVSTGAAAAGGGSDWGDWQSISTVYHQNRAINGATLTGAVISSQLNFDHAPNTIIPTPVNNIPITFTETVNTSTLEECGPNNPVGTKCDDKWSFYAVTFSPVTFQYGGETYEAEFQMAINNDSFADPIIQYNSVTGQFLLWTGEDETSSMDVQTRIRELPEPATLLLLGLGLFGVGFAKRRKIKS